MEINDYIRILRRNWLAFVVLPGIFVAVALVALLVQVPKYTATATVFVSVQQASTVQELSQGGSFTQQVVKSYATAATTAIVLDPVIRNLHLDMTSEELAQTVSATAPLDTVVMQISATNTNPTTAARIANEVAQQLGFVVDEITQGAEATTSPVKITRLQSASVPVAPTSPVPLYYVLGAILVGLVLAVAVSLLRAAVDVRIRTSTDVRSLTDSPIIGEIAFDPRASQRPLIVQDEPGGTRAEAFQSLRTNLEFLGLDAESRVLTITSSVQGEGKSTTAANLAIAVARTDAKVLIIDGDLRRPRLAEYLGVNSELGLTDVLSGRVQLDEALQTWGDGSLTVLPAGSIPPNPGELLQSARMGALLARLSDEYNTIIIDAPPLLPVADAAVLARQSSGALVVCSVRRATRHQLRSSLAVLEQAGAQVHGVILVMTSTRNTAAYGYGAYGYGYGYREATGQ